jgi:hypothetical protein
VEMTTTRRGLSPSPTRPGRGRAMTCGFVAPACVARPLTRESAGRWAYLPNLLRQRADLHGHTRPRQADAGLSSQVTIGRPRRVRRRTALASREFVLTFTAPGQLTDLVAHRPGLSRAGARRQRDHHRCAESRAQMGSSVPIFPGTLIIPPCRVPHRCPPVVLGPYGGSAGRAVCPLRKHGDRAAVCAGMSGTTPPFGDRCRSRRDGKEDHACLRDSR